MNTDKMYRVRHIVRGQKRANVWTFALVIKNRRLVLIAVIGCLSPHKGRSPHPHTQFAVTGFITQEWVHVNFITQASPHARQPPLMMIIIIITAAAAQPARQSLVRCRNADLHASALG